MAIEVTSLPTRHPAFRVLTIALGLTLVSTTACLLRSYRYYSGIIDARLRSGYLTSRPGIYAAPHELRVGQGISSESLVTLLRRAGYLETKASDVWSGSFSVRENTVEICPSRVNNVSLPPVVRVSFDRRDRIAGLTGDGLPLDAFSLEPEVLTSDYATKTGKHRALAFPDIPPVLVQAILSIEDHRFFDHPGLDLFGVARAFLRNAGDDRIGQGGSTITQQLVKNTYLSPERTLRRKFAEAMLAFALERRLSKQDIFALYCNEVYLGQRGAVSARGVGEAARVYFGKEVKDLSLGEAATIAGMIQGPTRYAPHRHAEAAAARRNTVLTTMVRDGWISSDQAAAAAKEPVVVIQETNTSNSLAPYFIDCVNRAAESRSEGSSLGRRVYTTIDLGLQQLAEAALRRQLDLLDSAYKSRGAKPEAALVALDPATGDVLAMVGGRDYAQSQLDRATDAHRQPGSTFKPFVYAAALESGLSPVRMFTDAPREFVYDQNKVYRPANFGGGYSRRDVTMRTGLVRSLNVVTVDVAMQTGLTRIANLAERFGLPKPEPYPALALGTSEVTPLQIAAAYATFVNGGRRVQPRVIASVDDLPGAHTLDTRAQDVQVISPTTAYMVTNMLAAVIDHGTARAARGSVKGTAVAGKTGTSRDGWFVGYTPKLVCAVWIGFDDNQQLGLTGATAALPAWAEFIKGAVELRPELGGRTFESPEGIKFVEIDADNGLLSTVSCPNRELIAVTPRLAPNFECFKHGNLPDLFASAADSSRTQEPSPKKERRLRNRDFTETTGSQLTTTRVDVDRRGRQTLVNEMRPAY